MGVAVGCGCGCAGGSVGFGGAAVGAGGTGVALGGIAVALATTAVGFGGTGVALGGGSVGGGGCVGGGGLVGRDLRVAVGGITAFGSSPVAALILFWLAATGAVKNPSIRDNATASKIHFRNMCELCDKSA